MVESLNKLNKICQKPRYKEVGNWMVRNILRDLALPITWLLLHTNVTANQVTLAALIVGLTGNLFLAFEGAGTFLTGMLLLQLWYLLDHVDGQIARYYQTSSLTGRFFDFIMHQILHGSFFFFISCSLFNHYDQPAFLVFGFLSSFAAIYFNLISDTKIKAFYEKLLTMKRIEIQNQAGESKPAESTTQPLKKAFSVLHKLAEFHVVMNLFFLTALLEFFLHFSLRTFLFGAYSLLIPAIAIIKTTYLIRTKRIDTEFDQIFHENDNSK